MSDKLYDLGKGFWNIRGSFYVEGKNGSRNVGTQCSLVKLQSGKFIFLDSYELKGDIREEIMQLTNKGQDVEAVLNVHPYHTVHCEQMAKDFPQAIFYGSRRHLEQASKVNWSEDLVESNIVIERYPELEFALPEGIYYVAPEEAVHAGSLLVFHPASKSLHVDDTFVTSSAKDGSAEIAVHPSTQKALKNEPDAGKVYCNWATQIALQWNDTRNFCAAHSDLIEFAAEDFEESLLTAIENFRAELTN